MSSKNTTQQQSSSSCKVRGIGNVSECNRWIHVLLHLYYSPAYYIRGWCNFTGFKFLHYNSRHCCCCCHRRRRWCPNRCVVRSMSAIFGMCVHSDVTGQHFWNAIVCVCMCFNRDVFLCHLLLFDCYYNCFHLPPPPVSLFVCAQNVNFRFIYTDFPVIVTG